MCFGSSNSNIQHLTGAAFPLDHDGECKKDYLKYMICLADNGNKNSLCREQSMGYLDCRMNKGLMAKEDWSKLGYSDLDKGDAKS